MIHRKLGNVSVPLAAVFLIGAIIGVTLGGLINRFFYEINPVLSDAFIIGVCACMLGFLGAYTMTDFLKARKAKAGVASLHGPGGARRGKVEGAEWEPISSRSSSRQAMPQ